VAINLDADPERVVQQVVACWEQWTAGRRKKERIWSECVMNYLCEVDEAKYDAWPWRSKVADTLSQETADTVASSILNGLFPLNEKYLDLTGDDERSVTTAPLMQAYLEAQLTRAGFLEALRPWVKQLAVIGNAPYLGSFGSVRRPHKRRERRTNLKTRQPSYPVITASAVPTVKFQALDAFDVVFDPKALSRDESLLVWRVVLSKARVQQMENLDQAALGELESVEGGGPREPSDSLKDKRARVYGLEAPEGTHTAADPDEIELLCAYGDLEVDGELFENQVVIVGNRTVLLRAETEPFWAGRPLGWGGYDQLWMDGYEKGPLESIRGVQSLVDTFQNQKADILNLIINGAFAYVNDGIIDPDNLWLRPGGFIEVGDLNNLKPLQPSANVALTYQEISQLREQAERSSGKSRFDMGQAPGGRRTAYEANLIRGGGSARANDILKHLANGPMEGYLQWALGTLQQLKWDSGEIPNDVLAGQYTLNYLGADLTTLRNFQIQNFQMAMQVAAQAPPEMTAHVNFRYVWQQLFRALTMDDAHALNSPEEAARILAQTAQRPQGQPQAPREPSGSGIGGQDAGILSLIQGDAA
jgi:hypothetical protein